MYSTNSGFDGIPGLNTLDWQIALFYGRSWALFQKVKTHSKAQTCELQDS